MGPKELCLQLADAWVQAQPFVLSQQTLLAIALAIFGATLVYLVHGQLVASLIPSLTVHTEEGELHAGLQNICEEVVPVSLYTTAVINPRRRCRTLAATHCNMPHNCS